MGRMEEGYTHGKLTEAKGWHLSFGLISLRPVTHDRSYLNPNMH